MAQSLFDTDTVHFARLESLIQIVPDGIASKPLLDTGPFKQVLFAMEGYWFSEIVLGVVLRADLLCFST